MIKKNVKNQEGFVALLTIILVSAAVLIMAFSASFLGLGSLEGGYTKVSGDKAFWMADSCMDEALERLRINGSYTGSNLSLGDASCIISVVDNGDSKSIVVNASSTDNHYKNISATVDDTAGYIILSNWNEI